MIKQYLQGEAWDNELYCAIGHWAVSEKVHKALGVPVTGRPDDIWHVCFDKNTPTGFAQLRVLKNKEGHIRYLYAETEARQGALIKACMAEARILGVTTLFTNDRETATIWAKYGFQLKHSHHGSFGRWERELK